MKVYNTDVKLHDKTKIAKNLNINGYICYVYDKNKYLNIDAENLFGDINNDCKINGNLYVLNDGSYKCLSIIGKLTYKGKKFI